MKLSIVLRYCGDFAAQLNFLVCNAAHLIKRLDIPGLGAFRFSLAQFQVVLIFLEIFLQKFFFFFNYRLVRLYRISAILDF